MNTKSLFKKIRFVARKRVGEFFVSPVKKVGYGFSYDHIAAPEKTIRVKVDDISHWYTGNRFDEITFPGEIRGGDWSGRVITREQRLENRSCYIGIREHFEKDVPWPETRLFKEKHPMLFEQNGKVKGTESVEELEQYYTDHYDTLFEQVKKNGLLPATAENPEINPLYIHIGPEGEIIYTVDGNHRLYFAMILGIDEMPVRVWMRHKKWQEIREKILKSNGKNVPSDLEQYLKHPDIITELN
jgi:hypothetical protein